VVTVVLPAMLRGLARGATSLEVEGSTLAAVLDAVEDRHPGLGRRLRDERGELRRYVNYYVDGEECRRLSGSLTPLPAGTELMIIPSVAGG
jgi:molybdopterin synthase sulfur carrier subunit